MEAPLRYFIRFDGLDAAAAGQAAETLRLILQDRDPKIDASPVRSDPEAMDFGSVLAVLLAAPAVVELAKGVADWLRRSPSSSVTIKRPDGTEVTVDGLHSRQVVDLAKLLAPANTVD